MPKNFKPKLGSGDLGHTDLLGGRRVPKTHPRVKLNALLDELSALLGLLKTGLKKPDLRRELGAIQTALIKISGLVAGMKADLAPETAALTTLVENRAAAARPPKKFVLPGRNETEALAHLTRTRARICEILAWELKAKQPAVYLNRLSDYLFLLAVSCAK